MVPDPLYHAHLRELSTAQEFLVSLDYTELSVGNMVLQYGVLVGDINRKLSPMVLSF